MSQALLDSVRAWTPELALSLGAIATIVIGVFVRRPGPVVAMTWLTLLGAGASLWMVQHLPPTLGFFGVIVLDHVSVVFRWLALGLVGLVALLVASSSDIEQVWLGEALGLLLFVGVGLMLMAEANHLLMAYLSMEFVSLGSYCLVALMRDARASEAALKYFLFGALSSGIMLFGISLLFGVTGEMAFPALPHVIGTLPQSSRAVAVLAVVLMFVGLAFKISMVPFHMWTPDVYEGAAIPITAMLSVGPKAAGLALLLRLAHAVMPIWETMAPLILTLTILTMTLGNVVAIVQQNIKRLLAYSTIGQVGYLLIGYAVNTRLGIEAVLVYLVAYLFMNLGVFACVVAVCQDAKTESLEAFRGLAYRSPFVACCLAVFLLSLAGIPPLLGFMGKFLLFGAALESHHVGLAVAAILNTAIALYYYVNIIRQMYLERPSSSQAFALSFGLRLAVIVCGLATMGLGLFPDPLLTWLGSVASSTLL